MGGGTASFVVIQDTAAEVRSCERYTYDWTLTIQLEGNTVFDSEFERNLFELRRGKLTEIEKLGQAAYPNQFPASHTIPQIRAKWGETTAETLDAERVTVAIAGRIMAIRVMGKAGFATLQQGGERLQIYVRLDAVGEQGWALYKLLDSGRSRRRRAGICSGRGRES